VQVFAIILGFVAVSVPALLEWQADVALSFGTLLGIAALGGGIAGRLLVPRGERIRAHLAVMAAGVVAAAGAFLLTRWWVSGRESVWNAELALTTVLGALPGVLLGGYGYQKLRRRDEPVPTATARDRRE
jgi:hypothetical protein